MGFSDHPRESARLVMPRNLYLSSTDATEYAWIDNRVQFQNGLGLAESLRQSPTKERCRKALSQWRWPEGFGGLPPARETGSVCRPTGAARATVAVIRLLSQASPSSPAPVIIPPGR